MGVEGLLKETNVGCECCPHSYVSVRYPCSVHFYLIMFRDAALSYKLQYIFGQKAIITKAQFEMCVSAHSVDMNCGQREFQVHI